MKELIDALVRELRIDENQARGGAGLLFRAACDKLGAGEFAKLLGGLPGLDDLMRQAPESGAGRLFGGLASALGAGNAAILAEVLAGFGKLGLSQDQAKRFVPVILSFLRERLGPEVVATLESALRR
ncbi:MAG: DUF2780 domain-containing protein [Pseudomonadota bacterium]|jgi:Protein of unknown function VcgC/VcgE (DUF2780).